MAETSTKVSLNDFNLVKVIGRGSYGKVMLAHHKKNPDQVYAVKMLRKENVVKRNQVEQTKTERNVLQNISHPFIVNLMFAFQTPTKLYFVLEFCPGGELFFHLSNEKRFTEGRTRFYASELLLAIEHLHKNNIIYRDLKPENVLLDSAGHVKLTDFGLSKEGIEDNVTTKTMCGTPEYLAPEILDQKGHGKTVDWYSLGALIFEMLTGFPPYYCKNRDELFKRIRSETLSYPPVMSSTSTNLCQALLLRNPKERLGSAGVKSVQAHPFWGDMDWNSLLKREIEPPFKPEISGKSDTKYFASKFLNEKEVNSGEGATKGDPLPMHGFTYEPGTQVVQGKTAGE